MKWYTFLPALAAMWQLVAAAYSDDEMKAIAQKKGKYNVIQLYDDNFEKFLQGPRDYHLIVYLSSESPQLNCLLCREVRPLFETIANSWAHFHPDGFSVEELEEGGHKNVYFLEGDFVNSKKLFAVMSLDSIPKIFHFPPTLAEAPKNAYIKQNSQYQFYQGDHTQLISQWVREILGVPVDIFVPLDWNKVVMNAVVTFAAVFLVRRFNTQFVALAKSSFIWGSALLLLVLLCISGYMFNQIRGSPFVREKGDGSIEYFALAPQSQYGLETQVISSLYGVLGISFLLLVNKAPKIKNPQVHFLAICVLSLFLYLGYSVYLFLFSIKSRGYPYTFLNFGAI